MQNGERIIAERHSQSILVTEFLSVVRNKNDQESSHCENLRSNFVEGFGDQSLLTEEDAR